MSNAASAPAKVGAVSGTGQYAAPGQRMAAPRTMSTVQGLRRMGEYFTNREQKGRKPETPEKQAGKKAPKPKFDPRAERKVHDYLTGLAKGEPGFHPTGFRALLHSHGIDTTNNKPLKKKDVEFLEKFHKVPKKESLLRFKSYSALNPEDRLDQAKGDERPGIGHAVRWMSELARTHLKAHHIDKIVKSNKIRPEVKTAFIHAQLHRLIKAHAKDMPKGPEDFHAKDWYTSGMNPIETTFHHLYSNHEDDPQWGKVDYKHPDGPRLDLKGKKIEDAAPAQVAAKAVLGMTSAQRNPVDNAINAHKMISHGVEMARKHGGTFIDHLPRSNHKEFEQWKADNPEAVASMPKPGSSHEEWLKWRENLGADAAKKGKKGKGKVGYMSMPAIVDNETGRVLGQEKVGGAGLKPRTEADRIRWEAIKGDKTKHRKVNEFPALDEKGNLKPKAFTTANDALNKNVSKLQSVQEHVRKTRLAPKDHPKYTDPTHPEWRKNGYDHDTMHETAKWLTGYHTPDEIKKAYKLKEIPDKGGYHKGNEKLPGTAGFGAKFASFIMNMSGHPHETTHDVWVKRMHGITHGDVVLDKEGKPKHGAPRSAERKPLHEAFTKVGEETGHTGSAVQAIDWEGHQQSTGIAGVPSESLTFTDAANELHKAHGSPIRFKPNGKLAKPE